MFSWALLNWQVCKEFGNGFQSNLAFFRQFQQMLSASFWPAKQHKPCLLTPIPADAVG